jgi:aspartate/methionine/tyrosine aminotransferase
MELFARANELVEQGHDVIKLEVGEPDFDTPAPVIEAAEGALRSGNTRYTDARGILPLREKIAAFYADRFGVVVGPERIFVTAGASGGLLLLTALLINPGENLLMTDPGYPCNRHFLTSFDAEGVLVPVTAEDNYQLTPRLLDRYWNPLTRGVLVATPANPTGSVLSQAELAALAQSTKARNGLMIVDEIYQGLVYENELSHSVLAVEPEAFVVNSFSKYFGMTGWRLGWVIVPEVLSRELEKLAQNLFICPSTIAQAAALAAFSDEALDIMESQKEEFARRRNFLVPALRELGFDVPLMPAGAFYVYAGLPDRVRDAEKFCHDLLENEHVAITPGTDFGFHDANRFVRISYARDLGQLKEAVSRLRRALA